MKITEYKDIEAYLKRIEKEVKTSEINKWYDEDIRRNFKKGVNEKARYKGAEAIYKNICAFDIETTELDEIKQSIIYSWQFGMLVFPGDEIIYYQGRDYISFQNFILRFERILKKRVLIYVHNLSYEFGFIYPLTVQSENLIISSRHVLKAQIGANCEFRCSYLLTGKSLERFLKDMKVDDLKLSGEEFNYSKKRFPYSELTEREREYCRNDVIGLIEAIIAYIRRGGYRKLQKVPYTKTGVVRARMRDNKRRTKENIDTLFPANERIYKALCYAFRGGDTHRNREKVGYIIDDVTFYDRKSRYPAEMLKSKVPMTPLIEVSVNSVDISDDSRAYLLLIEGEGIVVKDGIYCPYLSFSKCKTDEHVIEDNGRILKAGYIKTWVTDIDYKIITEQYAGKFRIIEAYRREYEYLPKYFRYTVLQFYNKKSELKGVKGKEFEYMQSKEAVNSCYGFCAEKPLKDEILFDTDTGEITTKPYIFEVLKNNISMLQWGVWITRQRRRHLQGLIKEVGEAFVYCDTDSVAVDEDITNTLQKYNLKIKKENLKAGDGQALDIGIFEVDKCCKAFLTYGAKKYIYEDESGLHVTIAGVQKQKGAKELEKAGGIKAAVLGFEFKESGGTAAVYNKGGGEIRSDKGHIYKITPNVYIYDVPYTLGITDNYRYLLGGAFSEQLYIALKERLKIENI